MMLNAQYENVFLFQIQNILTQKLGIQWFFCSISVIFLILISGYGLLL
jgi:hypothetical protein